MAYRASNNLERFIKYIAPPHVAVADAPDSYTKLMRQRGLLYMGQPLPVYNGGCDRTIYSNASVNYAFRAWHDKIHITHELDFSPAGEQGVLAVHLYQMGQYAREFHLVPDDFSAVIADVLGQVMYYQKAKAFVDNQAGFVSDARQRGILNAIEEVW